MMKKTILLFMMMAACITQGLQAQVYVLNDATERNFSTISSYTYNLDGRPAGELTFEAKCVAIFWVWGGDLRIKQYVNGSWTDQLTQVGFSKKDTYYSFGPITLDRNATRVQLYTETGATGYKYFKNVKVTMATYLEKGTEPTAMSTTVETPVTTTFSFNHSNVAQLSVSSSNPMFTTDISTVSGSGSGLYGTQSVTVTYNPTAAGSHSGVITVSNGTQTITFSVSGTATKHDQTITWNQDLSTAAITDAITLNATASTGKAITYTSSNANVALIQDGVLSFVAEGSADITATQEGDYKYAAATAVKTVNVSRITPTVSAVPTASALTYGQTLAESTLTGGTASVEGTFAWADATVTPVGGEHTYTVNFTPANTAFYNATTCQVAVTVNKATQTITWEQDLSSIAIIDTITLNASASSGLEVTFASTNTDVAVILDGNKLAFTGAGEATIMATQAGNENYDIAQADLKNISVTRIDAVVTTVPTATTIAYGQTLAESTFSNGEVNAPGTFAWADATVAPNVGSHTYTVNFTPANTAFYNATTCQVAVTVNKAEQTITWEQDLSSIAIIDTITLSASASSGLEVTFASTNTDVAVILDGNKLAFIGAGEATIMATQAGNENYDIAQANLKNISVTRIDAVIATVPTATTITYGQTLAESVLSNGITSVEGTFTWDDATVAPDAGSQIFTVNFTPANTAFYNAATCEVTITINKAAQTITWEQDLSNLEVGSTTILRATSSTGMEVTYSSESLFASISDSTLQIIGGAGTSGTITATQEGNGNYEAANATLNFSIASGATTGNVKVNIENLQVYPNPTVDVLHIKAENMKSVAVCDVLGRLIQKQNVTGLQEVMLNVSDMNTATYILLVETTDGKIGAQAFIKK